MNGKKAAGFIVAFFALTVMPHIAYFFFGKYVDTTNYENRVKAPRPTLSIDEYRNFPKKYESFFNDHIPFRNQLVRMNSSIDYFFFNRLVTKDVVAGKDGWLFYYTKAKSNPVRQSLGYWHLKNEELETIAENLIKTRDELKRRDIDFLLFIAPNKESIYGEFIPDDYPVKDKTTATDQLVEYLKKNTDIKVVYPKKEILAAKRKYTEVLLYPKFDTHWNDLGAYFGVAELAKKIGVTVPAFEEVEYTIKPISSGDLAKKLNIKIENGDIAFKISKLSDNKTERKVLDEKDQIWDFVTTKAEAEEASLDKRRVFLHGDSYRINMAPSLSPLFSNVRIVHREVFTPQQVYDYGTDIFVYEVIERHIRRLLDFRSIYQFKETLI